MPRIYSNIRKILAPKYIQVFVHGSFNIHSRTFQFFEYLFGPFSKDSLILEHQYQVFKRVVLLYFWTSIWSLQTSCLVKFLDINIKFSNELSRYSLRHQYPFFKRVVLFCFRKTISSLRKILKQCIVVICKNIPFHCLM